LQLGPPFVALALAGIWLFHLSTQAALVAAVLAIGICVTYGAVLRVVFARDREIEMAENELRLKAELDSHKKELEHTNHRLEVRLRELSLLFDITRTINSTLELGELIKLLTETVGVALGFQEFAMLLLDEGSNELKVAATYGFPKQADVETMRIKPGDGAVGRSAERAEIVLVENVADKPNYLPYTGRPTVGSFLAVPLKYKGRVIGVMSFNRPTVNAFAPEEIKLLAAIANQAAMAIVNAHLYAETVELSLTDPLTNTANRRHLFQKLELELSRAQRFGNELSILMIDIDHFKLYNDRYGHLAGDEVLKGVGAVLGRTVRRIDTVARYGGEEFAIVLPQIRRQEAFVVAEKLRRAVSLLAFPSEGQERGSVTVSIGLAHFPADAQDVRELVARADAALYAAKDGGRNRLVAYSSLGRAPLPAVGLDRLARRRPSGSLKIEASVAPKV
jgi:diguanylate cyclase (GGDEF)-like protein